MSSEVLNIYKTPSSQFFEVISKHQEIEEELTILDIA